MFQTVQLIQAVGQGFRGYEKTYTFQFEVGKNEFIGDNGKGKSSLGELISWVLTGRSVEGKQKELNVVNKKVDRAMGRVVFRDENGKVHEVERKVNTSTTIKYNLETISQKKLDGLIPAELFLLVYNPIYFLSFDKDASRNTIQSLIPTNTKEDVMAEMNKFEREILEKETFDMHNTNEFLKNRRDKLREIDENRKHLVGYMAKVNEKIEVPEAVVFDEAPLKALQEQIDGLLKQKAPLKSMEDVLKQRNEIQKELSEIQHMPYANLPLRQELHQEKAVLEQKLLAEKQKEYTPFSPSELNAKLTVMRGEYKVTLNGSESIDEKVKELQNKQVHFKEGDACPSCKQVVSKEAVSVLAEELQKEVEKEKGKLTVEKEAVTKTLAQLAQEGKDLVASIEASQKEDDLKRSEFEKAKALNILTIEKRLKEIEQQLGKLAEEEKAFEDSKKVRISEIQKKMDALGLAQLEEENKKIQLEFDNKIQQQKAPLQEAMTKLTQEKEEVLKKETLRQNKLAEVKKQEEDVLKYDQLSKKYDKEEQELELRINVMKNFNAKKIELVNRTISAHMQDVSINLQKTVPATGEIKDCFEIMYDGKELKICSTAETIKAGLELSHMIATLSEKNYPVFVDNRESITQLEPQSSQWIEVKVVEGKELTKVKGNVETVIVPTESNEKAKAVNSRSTATA